GSLSVIGVVAAMVASLSFTPAVLALLPPVAPRAERPGRGRRGLGFERLAERAGRFALARRRPIFVAAGAVFALSLAGASQLRIGTQQISKFAADAPVRTDFEAVNRHLGGANPLYVVVESESLDAFKDPANLRVLEQLQDWLRAQPEIGATASLVDTLKLIHRGFRDGDPAAYAVPESRRLVSQLFFFGGSQELDRFVDPDYRTASLHLRARVIDSDDVAALVQRIETRLAELPASLQGRVTGTSVVLAGALDDIIRGQTLSVLAALGIIYAILAALFVSFRIGAVALIPNVLPVAAFFGALGALGIRLGPGISLVAPMVLGIAVDDTIHYFSRFIREVRRSADEERATVTTLQAVGRPVTYTSLALVAGFLVLTTSELRSQVELGAMASFALGFAWLTDFFVTPALCARLRIATLWDLLSVDLGRDPHRSISLLRGLRASEARIVALLASVVHVREGEHLFREGEPGEAVYAVLDGRLRTSTAHGTGRLELARHERGDALGEVGLLHLARSADVEALRDARLLRFTQESIDQLARRYPRIATVVYRNLSEIAADRLARATSGLRDAASGTVAHAPALPDPRRDAGRLERAGRALADAFFGDDGAADRAALAHTAAEADGGTPGSESALLLAALGLRPDVVAALTLLPLVEVAWSDGRLQPGERQAVLAVAAGRDTPAEPALLHRLGVWLDRPPTPQLRANWRDAVAAVCAELSVESRMRLRDGLLASARGVAESAGGLLGVGSVSRREARVLVELESAFSTR
nr:cyclic nucleotide-binding domain-containing protein [Myxococcota bacterium]